MSRRPNHTAAGLGFILVCLVIAFAIYVGMKSTPRTDENVTNSAVDNALAPAVANDDATAGASPGPPPDPDPSEGGPSTPQIDPGTNPNSASPTDISPADHAEFYKTCTAPDGPTVNGMNDSERPGLCECMFSRLASYGSLTRENGQLAYKMCRLQFATDRDRFDRTYAPGSASPDAADAAPDSPGGQSNDQGQP